jgi:GNAT superfamily N-acetyltransferase
MFNISLRPETAADDAFLRNLYASTRSEEMAVVLWGAEQKTAFLNQQFDLQRQHYCNVYADADFMLIYLQDKPIGRWYLHHGAEFDLLVDVSLLPDYRNRGIGRKLLENQQSQTTASGKALHLHVDKSNRAQQLYARLGFVCIAEDDFYRLLAWG